MAINPGLIRRLIEDPDYSRGEAYHRKGRVISCTVPNNTTVMGKVAGSRGKTYGQTITLEWNHAGRLSDISGYCTCPVGYNCKHVAAVMLEASTKLDGDSSKSAPLSQEVRATVRETKGHDPALTSWLARLRENGEPQEDDPEAYPPQVRDRLYYVIEPGSSRPFAVTLMKVTLRKDGTPGGKPRQYNPSFLRSGQSPRFIRPSDMRVCTLLDRCNFLGSWYYSPTVDSEDLTLAFRKMIETGRARWKAVDGVTLAEGTPRKARFEWRDLKSGAQQLHVIDEEGKNITVLEMDVPYYVDPDTGSCGPIEFAEPPHLVSILLGAPKVPPEAAAQVAETLEGITGAALPLPARLERETRDGGHPTPVLELRTLKANPTYEPYYGFRQKHASIPVLRIGFDYGGHYVPLSPRKEVTFRDDSKVVVLRRNENAENAAINLLEESGATLLHPEPHYKCKELRDGDLAFFSPESFTGYAGENPDGEIFGQDTCLRFMAETVPELRQSGWSVKIDKSWPYRLHEGPATIYAGVGGTSEQSPTEPTENDWFSFSLEMEVNGRTFDILPVVLSIIDVLPGELTGGEMPLADASVDDDLIPDFAGLPEIQAFDLEAFLEDLVLYPQMPDGSYLRIEGPPLAPIVRALLSVYGLDGSFHQAEAAKVAELADALEGCGVPFRGGEALRTLGKKLQRLTSVDEIEPPSAFRGTLRPYQKTGYGWLRALCDTGFGGVLADDMGLGKTIQTLALLTARHIDRQSDRPSLLVVPTSLIGNWQREARSFAPDLKVLVLHGPDRKKSFPSIPDHHVIVTTYPLLHRDHETLLAHEFDLAILDEAQAVKNPAAAISKRIRDIKAHQRLALTGTPLENNLEELWSLFDWLVPGLLGNRKSFAQTFRIPIEKHRDTTAHRHLVSRIKPFLLRRAKEEVAPELPEKNEMTELVPLGAGQVALYETLRSAMDDRVRQAIRAKGINGSKITVLDALLKLRQACCDPGLVKLEAARKVNESAKRSRLMEMLEELIAEGRRVLVFSQFVEMLKLIEADVKARGWDYLSLTGQTKNRTELVAQFQSGDTPIFLISLKAGGVGLNLTAADTVILYDPWWNPAVERQAMDRVHRIGQDKSVFVYRLIADGTVEAAIQELQGRKQALADNLFEESGSGPLALTETDIMTLFQPIGSRSGSS